MSAPATYPPAGLPGLEPAWSRIVDVAGHGGFHVLERPAEGEPTLTVLAIHGNPTWSYLWRRLLALAPPQWRVIAVDHIGMGYSERVDDVRRLADRVADLGALTDAMGVTGPTVTVAHDWGGPISLGWGLAHRGQWCGAVLANTAVHQPAGAPAPTLIRLARWRPLLRGVTQRTATFVRGTTYMSRGMSADVIAAFRAPYPNAASRKAVSDFVADIPLEADHPSAPTLDAIAEAVGHIGDLPVFLAWGSDDPVFSDRYLRDLVQRMPHADVHRYEKARHLVTEDAPACIPDIVEWITHLADVSPEVVSPDPDSGEHMGAALDRRAQDTSVAIADLRSGLRVSWSVLAARTREIAAGLLDMGVRPGERIAMLVPPGPDLVAAVYASWRIGAVPVAADSGLGVRGMRRALRSAEAHHVIGIPAGLGLARTIGLPGVRILVGRTGPATRILGADATLSEVARRGRAVNAGVHEPEPAGDDDAIVVFTSGSTGPAKGVVYTHRRLCALRDALRDAYDIDAERDALVAAFAPWAVLGPALGIPSAIPDMDYADAASLTADATAAACAAVGGTIMWTSPTALRAIVGSADHLASAQVHDRGLRGLRLVLAAGAPVPVDLLDEAARIMPGATIATPYGMTEALPLTQISLEELRSAIGQGVLVGRPLPGVDLRMAPLGPDGSPADQIDEVPFVTGEVVVRAPWMRDRYDRRWATHHRADSPVGWHRTGDVGHLDGDGRLWIEGRLSHVLVTPSGPVTPVAAELAAQSAAGVTLSALVGIGPLGTQAPVIVLLMPGPSLALADVDLTMRVREAVQEATGVTVAAVLTMRSLPVDVRHRSKVDRTRIAREAAAFLEGDAGDG